MKAEPADGKRAELTKNDAVALAEAMDVGSRHAACVEGANMSVTHHLKMMHEIEDAKRAIADTLGCVPSQAIRRLIRLSDEVERLRKMVKSLEAQLARDSLK